MMALPVTLQKWGFSQANIDMIPTRLDADVWQTEGRWLISGALRNLGFTCPRVKIYPDLPYDSVKCANGYATEPGARLCIGRSARVGGRKE